MKSVYIALALLLCASVSLGACYRPLYGDKNFGAGAPSATEIGLNQVAIGNIADADGQKLRNALIDRFYGQGRPAKPRYELNVRFTLLEERLGILKDATTTRARETLTADYDLIDSQTRMRILTASSRSVISFSILDLEYANISAKENAISRGVHELADLITTRVLLALDK